MKKSGIITEILNKYGLLFKKAIFKRRKRINNFSDIKKLFISKSGLEVGGPSRIFRNKGFIPIYKIVKELDGCNFSTITIWEGNIESGKNYKYYKNRKGVQYILEATDLSRITSSKYDFVISSNCLEHIANPLKAIEEWIRVIKEDGLLLLILPNKDFCFDHNRQVTDFSHMLSDLYNNVKEDDLTHLDEILNLHDLQMDKPAGTLEQFRERSLKNFQNRALHQHVFDMGLLKQIFNYYKLEILLAHEGAEYIILGRKSAL